MDTIKATNKGNNIKASGKEGWEQEYTWNKLNDCLDTWDEDVYLVSSFHSRESDDDYDTI